ncbi:MAG: hypothetical protein KFF72_02405, partial [Arthrospira sp. SH-MAG29]
MPYNSDDVYVITAPEYPSIWPDGWDSDTISVETPDSVDLVPDYFPDLYEPYFYGDSWDYYPDYDPWPYYQPNDTWYEPNDTMETATDLGLVYSWSDWLSIDPVGDEDWFSFELPSTGGTSD